MTNPERQTTNDERRTPNDERRTPNDERPTIIVVAAAVIEVEGRFLITRRQEGVHLEGVWEFPGGKCDGDETLYECLTRELREELDVSSRVGEELFSTKHEYPDRSIELHFFRCELLGDPRPQLGQDMRWVARADLAALDFPPADAALIEILRRA